MTYHNEMYKKLNAIDLNCTELNEKHTQLNNNHVKLESKIENQFTTTVQNLNEQFEEAGLKLSEHDNEIFNHRDNISNILLKVKEVSDEMERIKQIENF